MESLGGVILLDDVSRASRNMEVMYGPRLESTQASGGLLLWISRVAWASMAISTALQLVLSKLM